MLHRRPSQLALQATLLLATEPTHGWRRVRDLARALGVSTPYLTKVLQGLTHVGLLRAVRGYGHGVRLARPPREICLWDVVLPFEPAEEFQRCLLGLNRCSDVSPCPLHAYWAPVRAQILQMLQTKSVEKLAAEARSARLLRWQLPESNRGSPSRPAKKRNIRRSR